MLLASLKYVFWRKVEKSLELALEMMERVAYQWFRSQHLELDGRWPTRRHGDKFRRRLLFRRVCYGVVLLAVVAIVAFVGSQSVEVAPMHPPSLGLPASMFPYLQREGEPKEEAAPGDMFIQDVVAFASEVMFLVRVPAGAQIPSKDRLECRYGGVTHFAYRKASAVHSSGGRAAILCGVPPGGLRWDVNSATVAVDGDGEIRRGRFSPSYAEPLQWNLTKVVYEAFPTERDVVLFAHGVNHTRGSELPEVKRLKQFQCVYGERYETPVTAQAQEVFRCAHPPAEMAPFLAGKKVTLRCEGETIATLAYYNPQSTITASDDAATSRKLLLQTLGETPRANAAAKTNHICSCTMIYNGAKFLKEWVYYHSHLGVEKFYLYDNNSEDGLDGVVAGLASFNVTKHAWPWVKTQEGGFSHCALLAAPECTWMLYTDLDEYLFPSKRFLALAEGAGPPAATAPVAAAAPLPAAARADQSPPCYQRSTSPILAALIQDAVAPPPARKKPKAESAKVGQVTFFCQNFGPSGLTASPSQGVTQGYTCRARRTERHKALVLLGAVADSLQNVIHHFSLKPGYRTHSVKPGVAIVNHYKFQVWDEFKTKFHRRAATYVADWTEDRNHASKDRVPDLGTKPVKPADWESRYCEVQDYGLRDYTRRIFGSFLNESLHLAWE